MTWYIYRREVAVNTAGGVVPSGSFTFTDINGAAQETRAHVTPPPGTPPGIGTGTGEVLPAVTVSGSTAVEFEAQVVEGYAKSGTLPAIYMASVMGVLGEARQTWDQVNAALASAPYVMTYTDAIASTTRPAAAEGRNVLILGGLKTDPNPGWVLPYDRRIIVRG